MIQDSVCYDVNQQ